MSWLDMFTKLGGSALGTVKQYPFETATLGVSAGLAGASALYTQKGYNTALERADRIRQLGQVDRQLAAIDATRRLSTIKASNASPGYASLGVRATEGSPVDTMMYAEASEHLTLDRLEMAHQFLVTDTIHEAKALRQAGFFEAGQTLMGSAAQYGLNMRLAGTKKPPKKPKGYYAPTGFGSFSVTGDEPSGVV